MSSFFSWDLVWEFFPKILSALPVTLLIVGIATFVGLVLGSFIAFIRVEKNTDIESNRRSICFLYSRDADSCPVIHRLLRCAQPLTGDPD